MIWMHRIAEVALPMFRRADADADDADEPWLFPDLDGQRANLPWDLADRWQRPVRRIGQRFPSFVEAAARSG